MKKSIKSFDELYSLKAKLSSISDVLFIERIQPTKVFFKPKVQDYIEPKDWKNTDPCGVTVFRNANEDLLIGQIFNIGGDADVMLFFCPYFKEDVECVQDCRYRHKYNEYLELKNKLIPAAQQTYEQLVVARKEALRQICARKAR